MRIVIAANSYWNFYNFRLKLIKKLLKKNEIILIAPKDKYSGFFKSIGCETTFVNFNPLSKSIFETIKVLNFYYKFLEKKKIDLVINFTIKPNILMGIICIILKKKFITNVTGLGSFMLENNFLRLSFKKMYQYILEKSDFVFFQNKEDSFYFSIKNKKKKILPSLGVTVANKIKIKKKIPFIFLYCGRMIRDKGIKEYLLAAEKIKKNYAKEVQFKICGNFDDHRPEKDIKKLFLKLKKKNIIKYTKFQNNPAKIILNSNCIILPSYREGTSKVLLEAMSYAKPILASNVPGCKHLVYKNQNGFLFNKKDFLSLAEAIIKMLNLSIKDYNQMCRKSYYLAKNKFNGEIVLKKYLKALDHFNIN